MAGNARRSVLERYYEYIDAERYEDLYALFADDIVYHRPGQSPIEGKPAFRRFYEVERPLEDGTHDIQAYIIDGDRICARGTFDGRLDGESVSFGFADIHRFDDEGQICERWTYTDLGTV